jgi:hypothetical protein
MTVYVDPLREVDPRPGWKWNTACHLIADSLDELHAFAARLGLRRAWFQPHRIFDHYDLHLRKRKLAVKLGAVEVDMTWLKNRIRAKQNERAKVSGRSTVDC